MTSSSADLCLFAAKTIGICLLVLAGFRFLSPWMHRLANKVEAKRKRLELEYQSISDDALAEILRSEEPGDLLKIMAALNVAEPRLPRSEELNSAVRALENSSHKMVRWRVKRLLGGGEPG
jgi:hypothetical protein